MAARELGGTLTERENWPLAPFSQRVVMRPFTVGTAPSAKVRPPVSGRTSNVAKPPLVGWMPRIYFGKRYPGEDVQAWFGSKSPTRWKPSQQALFSSNMGR